MLPIRSRRYCAGRVIYGHSYRYPQPNFTFVSRGYFTALRRASSSISSLASARRPGSGGARFLPELVEQLGERFKQQLNLVSGVALPIQGLA
jgi:hypothetical protein